jgi:pyruvate kinase
MLDNSKQREKKLARMLKNFHKEQQELTRALGILMDKGPSVRIKDLKNMLKAFYTQHQDEAGQLDELLEEMDRAKEEISSQWNKFMIVQNNVRGETHFLDYKS